MNTKAIQTDILIVGAGPVGLFTVFEAGLLELHCEIVDNLPQVGGQCTELYPEKPIYDIPGVANQTAQEHVDALMEQIKPFNPGIHLNDRVDKVERYGDGWEVTTQRGKVFHTCCIFIAAGAGCFEPRKPVLDRIEKYEKRGRVEYRVLDKSKYDNKTVVIAGGGDSALDWALELSKTAKLVKLVHRTDKFRGSPHTLSQLEAKENVKIKTHFDLVEIDGENLRFADKTTSMICPYDNLLVFWGLKKELGPIANWELEIHNRKVQVDPMNSYETNVPRIFAVGDISTYRHKLDLILCGFHEATMAVQKAYEYKYGKWPRMKYTTSNPHLQRLLGVSNEKTRRLDELNE